MLKPRLVVFAAFLSNEHKKPVGQVGHLPITHNFTEGKEMQSAGNFCSYSMENRRVWIPGSGFEATQWNPGQHTRDMQS